MRVLAACVTAPHACLVSMQTSQGYWIPWDQSYRGLSVAVWVLELKLCPLKEYPVLLINH